jgi:hypothetical protein
MVIFHSYVSLPEDNHPQFHNELLLNEPETAGTGG